MPYKRRVWAFVWISLSLLLLGGLATPVAAQPPSRLPHSDAAPVLLAQSTPTTTLSVAILSAPWVVLDNKPAEGPQVFVVQIAITNTGAVTANDVVVTLDYNDPVNGWVLLPGETPTRTHTTLAPGSVVYDYWFARYPPVTGASFQYAVRAQADNAAQVATSDNAFGNPAPDKTVETRKYLSTGNSGITQAAADVSVGRAFTVTVDYSWTGTSTALGFSPAGNVDYDPGAYRLLSTQVRLYSAAPASGGTLLRTVNDRLYVTQIGAAQYAQTEYTFIAVTANPTQLCPYTGVDYGSTQKYDTNYCTGGVNSTIIAFDSVLATELTKQVNTATVQQGESLTYTLRFTNSNETTGNLLYVWIWDEATPSAGAVVTTSLTPSGDSDATTPSRAAWYLNTVAPGFAGTYTFTFHVDGDGVDLPDQMSIVNHAFFGINEGSVPPQAALTDTVTVTLQAPVIHLSQSNGLLTTDVGQPFAYTLRITNSGTITATNVVITDVLPAYVTLTGPATPAPNVSGAGWLAWTWDTLAPGQSQVLTVPVQTVTGTPDGTVLLNTVTARYCQSCRSRLCAQGGDGRNRRPRSYVAD